MTLALVGLGLLLSFIPGIAEALEYNRQAVESGQIWRLLTGQLVHWTPRMTLADLGAILLLGVWLEMRSRKLLIASPGIAAWLIAAGLYLLTRDLDTYRGSSGLAAALFTTVALLLMFDRGLRPVWRGVALLAILLLGAKMLWETQTGTALAAGHLPPGVQVTPLVHLLGAIAGAGAFAGRGLLLNVAERAE